MNRYSVIHTKLPREFVLLQGTGCKWKKCLFCDYHTDISNNPYEINKPILEKVTGIYGVLDVINSGSGIELDNQTISEIQKIVIEKKIHTLWFEMHYMYRHKLVEFSKLFPNTIVKFRCGIETFDPTLRQKWNKGVPQEVTAQEIAKYFKGVCLLCGTAGETKEHIIEDIDLAKKHFEYFSINLFCNNSTNITRDEELVRWFNENIYPNIKDDPKIEVLFNNADLGVG